MKTFILPLLIGATLTMTGAALAADDFVYGRQLMTQQELAEHRAKMRSLKTQQERDAYRQEHHTRMQERAKAQGLTLPEAPRQPPRDGRGTGNGPRDGMGPREGMGMGR